jgi:hypothetical protein
MKNSIDYNDIFDIMIKKVELSLTQDKPMPMFEEQHDYLHGRLSVLKELREISEGDIHEYHSVIAAQLLKVRRVVAKM